MIDKKQVEELSDPTYYEIKRIVYLDRTFGNITIEHEGEMKTDRFAIFNKEVIFLTFEYLDELDNKLKKEILFHYPYEDYKDGIL